MNKSQKNPGPVPPRWLHCPRKSDGLIVNKFMVMKTPLSSNFDDQVPPECRFTPKMVFANCKLKKVNIEEMRCNINHDFVNIFSLISS